MDKIYWTPKFAYGLGLLASDGSISKDGRHICFTSKDLQLINNFLESFSLGNIKIGKQYKDLKLSTYRVQFGNVKLYNFLLGIGFIPNKSKTIKEIKIPQSLFFHFLRGVFDGDGSFYSYKDKRYKNSNQFYTSFASASLHFLTWISHVLDKELSISGKISLPETVICGQLKFAKRDSLILLSRLYKDADSMNLFLERKRLKIRRILDIVSLPVNTVKGNARVAKLVDAQP